MAASAQGLKVRLVGKANGVGLSRDFDLLAQALRDGGCEVSQYGCEKPDRKRRRSVLTRLAARLRPRRAVFDANIMLEHVWPQFLHQARRNILVPNPEWFDRRDVAFLSAVDCVWTKTALAERLFDERGRRTLYIGFDSEDRYLPAVTRLPQFLHLAGRSPLKGTQRLLALWRRHPEWPRLTVIQDVPEAVSGAANLVFMRGYLSDDALKALQNAHRFHICTSEAEGWGHYIAEALSVGAVTLTCDAAPMNELVTPERGILITAPAAAKHNLVRIARFDEAALEQCVARALALDEGELAHIATRARAWFLDNKAAFTPRVAAAASQLAASLAEYP